MTNDIRDNIIIISILVIIIAVLYYRFKTKEGFQTNDISANDLSANILTVPLNITDNIATTNLPTPTTAVHSVTEAQAQIKNAIGPQIASNPELKGVFNSDSGPDIRDINVNKVLQQAAASPPKNVTAIDRRPLNDIGRKCDTLNLQITTAQNSMDYYRLISNWEQVRNLTISITQMQNSVSELGC